ncbi:MAG TPA: hypothetical protein DCG75_07740 [Bacteroidales bacterium]|nr:hypothetical protein [Bacteroidales bacterium]
MALFLLKKAECQAQSFWWELPHSDTFSAQKSHSEEERRRNLIHQIRLDLTLYYSIIILS